MNPETPAAPYRRAQKTGWVITAVLAVASLAVGGVLVGGAVVDGTPSGVTADGSVWGKNLGAVVSQGGPDDDLALGREMLQVSPDGKAIYALTYSGVRVYSGDDLATSTEYEFGGDVSVSAIAMSPDGSTLYATTGGGGDTSGKLIAMSVLDDGRLDDLYSKALVGPGNMSESIAISPDGQTIYTADSNTRSLHVLDASTGAERAQIPGQFFHKVVVNPVSGLFYGENGGDSLIAYSPETLEPVASMNLGGKLEYGLVTSRDGTVLYRGDGRSINVYDAASLALIKSVKTVGKVNNIVPTEDATQVYAHTGNRIDLIDFEEEKTLVRIPLGSRFSWGSLAIGQDGHHVFASPVGEHRTLVHVDTSASRTNWASLWAGIGGLFLIALLAALITLTIPQWKPALEASRARSQLRKQSRANEREVSKLAEQDRARGAEAAQRVEIVRQWQAAYSAANNGATPPPGFMPPVAFGSTSRAGRTNTMAILSLIFGIGGGLLGIIFGHIALSQIRRTMESGRGLAITGLVFGYLGLAIVIGLVILYLSLVARFS